MRIGRVGSEQRGRGEIVGEARRHLGQKVGSRGRDDDEVRILGQAQMPHLALVGEGEEVVVDALAGQRRRRERGHEARGCGRHDDADRGAALAQAADEVEPLIGGDAARDHQQDAPAFEHFGLLCHAVARNRHYRTLRRVCNRRRGLGGGKIGFVS